jgi:catechol 2,3-dioxygenase-like lactoylglutathione lyase family enzyme
MLEGISHVFVWVRDQDEAKAFYTEKLGLEERGDVTLAEEFGGFRWLTVGPAGRPEVNIVLARPGPPLSDSESAEQLLALVAKGVGGPGILHTSDCRKTCKELEERGVELSHQPEERFYGIDAGVRDPSGNAWRIVQPLEFDAAAVQR